MKLKITIITLVIGIAHCAYSQVHVEQVQNSSSFEGVDEVARIPFNDFFKEINPMEMTFQPTFVIDSINWKLLDIDAIYELDIGDVEISAEDKYYGIGQYEHNGISFYFVGMPLDDSDRWGVTVFICSETGEFTDGYMIAYAHDYEGEEMTKNGWVEYNKFSNEIIFITRMQVFYSEQDTEGEPINEIEDCKGFCVREGQVTPYSKGNIKKWNTRYQMSLE